MSRKHLRSVVSSWQTEDEKVDIVQLGQQMSDGDDFHIFHGDFFHDRATDDNGHSKNIQVNIPTTFASIIQQILEYEPFPYRSAVEIARDALIHRVAYLAREMSAANKEVDQAWHAQVLMEKAKQEAEGKIRYLDNLETNAQLFVQIEDWARLLDLLYEAEHLGFPGNLKRRRDDIVGKFRDKIPQGYRTSYDTE